MTQYHNWANGPYMTQKSNEARKCMEIRSLNKLKLERGN
ncbi:hypothetical protein Taro_018289 [Colocasia esculenta]|uniref:Uncharacterized protein n=1 Tax=Colocasia esculenta TaxID=4460 RepID=A0A843UTG6_COLES|nr:hypothetical protein [Colocasia esculenta]